MSEEWKSEGDGGLRGGWGESEGEEVKEKKVCKKN
jgi:hypothetical protein